MPWDHPTYDNAELAVQETSNFILIDNKNGGCPAPTWFAASTNSIDGGTGNINSGSAVCKDLVSQDTLDGWAGDPDWNEATGEYFESTGKGFPCHADDVLDISGDTLGMFPNKGYPRAGHGAGLSQTGALRWAVGTQWNPAGQPYTHPNHDPTSYWDENDIGDAILADSVLKDWRQILMHYYVFPFVSHASEPGQEQRWYQISVADSASNASSTSNRLVLEAGAWEGTEVTILSDVHVKIGNSTSDDLELKADESGRTSYLICKEGSSVEFSGKVMGISAQVEATCTGNAGKTANMRLNKGGEFKADDACLQAGEYANVTIASGETVDFKDGGFLSNQSGTFTLEDDAIIGVATTAGAPEVHGGSSFILGTNSKLVLRRDAVIGEQDSAAVTFDGGDIDIYDGHVEFWNPTFDTDDIIIHNGGNASVYGDNILISANFEARVGSTFRAGPDDTSFPSEANTGGDQRLAIEGKDESEEETPAEEQPEDIITSSNASDDESITIESYPNPFNPTTTIRYRLEADAFVTLKVYNMLGQEVNTLLSDFQTKGVWESLWNGRDNAGTPVASGTYLYQLTAGDITYSGTMVFLK